MSLRKKLERLAFASADTSHCPDSDTFAQFVLGELDETTMSQVGLHIHSCPICSADYAVFRERRKVSIIWPSLFGAGATLPDARRGAALQGVRGVNRPGYTYTSEELTVTMSVSPDYEEGERYRLTGWLLKGEEAIARATIKLKGPRKSTPINSEQDGSFSFDSLYAGTYALTVTTDQIELVIREISVGS